MLEYCDGFCRTSTWIGHRYACVLPHLEGPHLRPHPIPLGCLRALALGALLHALSLYCSSIFLMIMYMCQCYSLKSSYPRLLPQSPKVCSLHLVLFAVLHIGFCCYHLSKFHIYVLVYCIGVFLSGLLHSV